MRFAEKEKRLFLILRIYLNYAKTLTLYIGILHKFYKINIHKLAIQTFLFGKNLVIENFY